MSILRHKTMTGLLALTVLFTVGAGDSYAQRGRFRNGGNNGNSNSGPKFLQNNPLQGMSSSKLGKSGGNALSSPSSGLNLNIAGRNGRKASSKASNINANHHAGGLQQILGNRKSQQGDRQPQLQGGNNGQLNGLQNLIGRGNRSNSGLNGNGGVQHKGSGIGNLMLRIQQNQQHGKVCVKHDDWCHTKPKACHWWYQYCKPIAYCEPQHHHHCQWNYVTCDYRVGGRVVLADARWYLGLKGLLLPGQGLGIEEITPGSPAASVGLQPGMVITRCNGIDLVDEAALGLAIEQSGGVLQMDLLLSSEGTPATCVVVMQRVASVSF